ncbi:MAG TPA: YdeI/OmpD-associated family protein [Solirubrobacteraceae bacterium]|nr:YdeI/OmpD-associated family protein [Solirubrobacteraceae bacterium]
MSDPQVDTFAATLSTWRPEFLALRAMLAETELTEALKWRKPCWTHGGRNIVIFQPFQDLCALLFFKGRLLADSHGLLREQGDNTRSALRLEFRCLADVDAAAGALGDLVAGAIRVEAAGLAVEKPPAPDPADYPEELHARLEASPGLRDAFERLTPGRRRGYLLYFTAAKRSATRTQRIERMQDRIMDGLGMHD